jgi:hypothetical protein
MILDELCQTSNLTLPAYTKNFQSLIIDDVRFDCDPECIEFTKDETPAEMTFRKVLHETANEYIRQNTALTALHAWAKAIHPVRSI